MRIRVAALLCIVRSKWTLVRHRDPSSLNKYFILVSSILIWSGFHNNATYTWHHLIWKQERGSKGEEGGYKKQSKVRIASTRVIPAAAPYDMRNPTNGADINNDVDQHYQLP